MSNLRQGTPSRGRNRRSRQTSPFFALLVLLAAALLIGLVIGFVIGRVTASHDDLSYQPPVSTPVDEGEGDGSASAEGSVIDVEPEPTPVVPTGIVVCLDPGHGGNDGGSNTEERIESHDNMTLALAVKAAMEAKGIEVVMTRTDDSYVGLSERTTIANNANADYFISLHRNTAGGVANGVEVWRSCKSTDEDIFFAEHLENGLVAAGISRDRGIHVGSQSSPNFDYQVLREATMPRVILEMGFIEMEEDNVLFDANQQAYAEAMAQAVLDTYSQFHS